MRDNERPLMYMYPLPNTRSHLAAIVIFVCLLSAALHIEIVARIATDIPIWDEWDAVGRTLLPKYIDGTLRGDDFVRLHNEHRIVFTNITNLALFVLNDGWDPFVNVVFNVLLRVCCVAATVLLFCRQLARLQLWVMVCAILVAFIPVLDWHNVIWGFQSQVWYSLGFSLAAILLFYGRGVVVIAGCLFACASLLSMGAGYLLPFALLLFLCIRSLMARQRLTCSAQTISATALVAAALLVHGGLSQSSGLRPSSLIEAVSAVCRAAAWPHDRVGVAMLAMNAPMIYWLYHRFRTRANLRHSESVLLTVWLWAMLIAVAAGLARGGSAEFSWGMPSRYVDFLVILPLANARAVLDCLRDSGRRRSLSPYAAVWVLFVVVGWAGLFRVAWQGIVVPRSRDRDGPVRVAVAFQHSRNPAVFSDQPRLYVPHPESSVIRAVLDDPRLRDKLPPSFQPEAKMGWLSRACRSLQRSHSLVSLALALSALVMLVWLLFARRRRAAAESSSCPEF